MHSREPSPVTRTVHPSSVLAETPVFPDSPHHSHVYQRWRCLPPKWNGQGKSDCCLPICGSCWPLVTQLVTSRLQLLTSLLSLQAVLMASARVPPDIHNEALSQTFPYEDARRRLLFLQH